MQDKIVQFFTDPQSYNHWVDRIEQCETHAAIVFLAGDYAYKVKRAVKLPYLDFSSLDKRHEAMARELELNSVNAPEIYLELVAVTQDRQGRLQFAGDGEVVEWAMKMRRFDQADIFSNMIVDNRLDSNHVKALAATIIDSHAKAKIFNETAGAARVLDLALQIAGNLERAAAPVSTDITRKLELSFAQSIKKLPDLLDRRGGEGYVRRCHGDLHLSNIVLFKNKPVLFDALEFSEELGTSDILYDLAFVLMDLIVNERVDLANCLLNQYLYLGNDIHQYEGLVALPLFMAMRAAIRAYVQADKALVSDDETSLKSGIDRYLHAALAGLDNPKPGLIAIGGLSGSGKTTIAAMLAPHVAHLPGAIHLRTDLIRKNLFNVSETERLDASAYTMQANRKVYSQMEILAEKTLKAGYSVIVDAVFSKADERIAMQKLADRHQAEFTGIWLDVPRQTLFSRVAGRKGDASDANIEVVKQQLDYDLGNIEWRRINADQDRSQVIRDVISLIQK